MFFHSMQQYFRIGQCPSKQGTSKANIYVVFWFECPLIKILCLRFSDQSDVLHGACCVVLCSVALSLPLLSLSWVVCDQRTPMETDRDKRDLVQQRKFVHRERFHNKKKNMLFPFSKQKKLFGLYRGVGGCPPQTNVFTFVVEPFPLSFLVKVS